MRMNINIFHLNISMYHYKDLTHLMSSSSINSISDAITTSLTYVLQLLGHREYYVLRFSMFKTFSF